MCFFASRSKRYRTPEAAGRSGFPHNRFAPGVYLVGGGTHPGSGLPVIFEGARISSRLLLEDFGLDPAFIGAQSSLAEAGEELGVAA